MKKIRRRNGDVKVVPSDVWFEILRRIPAADLVPLKAVCKTFHRLISSDLFARLHLEHFIKDPKSKRSAIINSPIPIGSRDSSYYYDPDKRTISIWHDEPRFGDKHSQRVIDSYHGLLLIEISGRLLLCNPITRSYKFLPSFSQMVFACCKIAYDDVSKQYKVFGVKIWPRKNFRLYVFDVRRDGESHQPRHTTEDCQNINFIAKGSILVNGNVYWLIIEGTETLDGETGWGGCIIISANVTTEKMKTRSCSIPPFMTISGNNLFVANTKFYFGRSSYSNHDDLQLWVLDGVESENPNPRWVIQHRIDTNQVSSTLSITPYFQRIPFGTFRGKVLIIIKTTTENSADNRLYQYDVSSKEIEEVKTIKSGNNIFYGMICLGNFLEHIDSLICLGPV